MTRLVITLPDEKIKISAITQMAKALGGTVRKEKQSPPAKTPRTKIEQDFVDAYKEALAFERGEIDLPLAKDLIQELKEKRDKRESSMLANAHG